MTITKEKEKYSSGIEVDSNNEGTDEVPYVQETPFGDKISEDNKYDIRQQDSLKDIDEKDFDNHVESEKGDEIARSATARPINRSKSIKWYHRSMFWVQNAEPHSLPVDLIPDTKEGAKRLFKILNKKGHGLRWLHQEHMVPIRPKEEFEYNRLTQNGFVAKALIILLLLLLVTVALEYYYLKYLLEVPKPKPRKKLRPWLGNIGQPKKKPKKKFEHKFPVLDGFANIGLSALALLVIFYFWTCSAWPKERRLCLLLSVLVALAAMSWLILSITLEYDTYICFFALFGAIVATAGCLVLSLIPIPKIDMRSWCVKALILLGVFCATGATASITQATNSKFKLLEAVISIVIACFIGFLIVVELQLVLTYRTSRIDEGEYVLVACLMYVSSITIWIKLIMMFDFIDAE